MCSVERLSFDLKRAAITFFRKRELPLPLVERRKITQQNGGFSVVRAVFAQIDAECPPVKLFGLGEFPLAVEKRRQGSQVRGERQAALRYNLATQSQTLPGNPLAAAKPSLSVLQTAKIVIQVCQEKVALGTFQALMALPQGAPVEVPGFSEPSEIFVDHP
jgi:hypothetical protein